jgi:2-phosphosulfolactate phosphatase
VKVVHRAGLAGARDATGAVVVIDVLRAFTVSAVALAQGADEVIYVSDMEEARALAAGRNAVLSAEVDGLPVEGVEISNSPSALAALDLHGRVLVQRSTSGVPAVAALPAAAGPVFAAALVVASATAEALRRARAREVTLIATGEDRGHPEDAACAAYLEAQLTGGRRLDLGRLLQPLYASDRYQQLTTGAWPGFPPTDLAIALDPDRYDFAMPVSRDRNGYPRVRREE